MKIIKAWGPVVLLCVGIFLFSQDAHSGRHSNEVLQWLLGLFGLATPHMLHVLGGPFRKFAHVVVYFLLGAFAYRGFAMGVPHFSWPAAWRTLVFCFLYAASDEYHQSFIASRGPSPRDVLLDTSASVLAMFLIWLWIRNKPSGRRANALAPENALPHRS